MSVAEWSSATTRRTNPSRVAWKKRAAPPTAIAKIGVTVWGWGNPITWPPDGDPQHDEADRRQTRWVSYAYPAGANIKQLNSVVLRAN
jgi:hypothetical protein